MTNDFHGAPRPDDVCPCPDLARSGCHGPSFRRAIQLASVYRCDDPVQAADLLGRRPGGFVYSARRSPQRRVAGRQACKSCTPAIGASFAARGCRPFGRGSVVSAGGRWWWSRGSISTDAP